MVATEVGSACGKRGRQLRSGRTILRKVKKMETDKVKIDGDEVIIKAGSAKEAHEIAAQADREMYRANQSGADGWIDDFLDGAGKLGETVGRPIFEWIAWALAIVGSVVAYLSWSRLTVDENVQMLFGAVGVIIILAVKVSAGRWAKASNKGDDEKVKFYSTLAIAGLVVNMFVAVLFQAATNADEQTGALDANRTIQTLEREERELTMAINAMQAPSLPLDILQLDLEAILNQPALNNANEATPLTVAEVIGWGTDDYCMAGGQYRSYVERYCPDVVDAHRAVKLRADYEAAVGKREAVRNQVKVERDARPETSSGLALGNEIADGRGLDIARYLPGALLMLIIELFMVLAQYIAKRHPKGV